MMEEGRWHSRDIAEIFKSIGSSPDGISPEEARRRLERFGRNELREVVRETALQMLLAQFKSLLVIILILAAVISAALGFFQNSEEEIIESAAILVVVFFIAFVGFIQEYRAEKELSALKKMVSVEAMILRDGKVAEIAAEELVFGDVVLLEAGDRIPADCRLFTVIDFRVDESALTGESVPVEKDAGRVDSQTPLPDRKDMVYMGTHATYGKAQAVVVATGMGTELGKIAEEIQAIEREKTPLQVRLDTVGRQIGLIVLVLCVIVFVVGLMKSETLSIEYAIYMGTVAIALAVAAVPEGLPAVVTIALAKGMKEMAEKNAIVKKLTAVETLGSTTIICSDKTGTLTRDEMTVKKIYVEGRIIDVSGEGYSPEGGFTCAGRAFDKGDIGLQILLRISTLANNASLEKTDGRWAIIGDPTEAALVVAASKAGLWHGQLSKEYPRIAEIPFSSERKRMTTVHTTPQKERLAYVKGAPDVILSLCSHVYRNGRTESLTEDERKKILGANDAFASDALRVLGAAFRRLADRENANSGVERDLVFVGLLGMIDPPREDAIEAARIAERAGIKVIIITGDYKLTAVAVAKSMGLYREGDQVITGADLDRIADADFLETVEDVRIYARVSPEHKLRIVDALKRRGHIVAMTGDGVNDAPALKKADIGIAMGVTGTDVSREAADMVLVDDDFASIVAAVEQGRGIYENIKLFIKYLLSCNIGEVLAIFIAMIAFARLPLQPLQILWMNLLTDAAPALALAWNPPDPDIMERKPRDPKDNIINRGTLAKFISIGVLMAAGTLFVFYNAFGAGAEKAGTLAFTTIIMFQMFYALTCRSDKYSFFGVGIFSNKYLVLAVLASLILQVLVIYLPALQNIFNTVPLDLNDWAMIICISSTAFIVPETWKMLKSKIRM